ncbi:OmpA family protein [Serratia sp. UGAL515B_01]|uniref:OmpA family protein n=1 Tax=Serratia sp. UGAL515B_01 TaxID=2986763 RepID=UPI002953E3CD|nr:OmpA family protein [Serratia sp. UGAL515B_01]WON77471.1 OmpA family protein [Serratia sp. UGAL515B_01]
MSKFTVRHALIAATTGVLLAFIATFIPKLGNSGIPLVIMLVLIVLMIVLQCRYELRELPDSPPPKPIPPSAPERPAVLILGPYAAKWFSQSNTIENARYASNAAWLLVSEPQELSRRLEYIHQHSPNAQVMAFFPILPDGHETSELMVRSLINWQNLFSGLAGSFTLPCVIGLYARLSSERRNNSPQNATWIGDVDFNQQSSTDFVTLLEGLKRNLITDSPLAENLVQRAAVGQHLMDWLQESGVAQAMEKLFTYSPLQPTSMILCDHGNGFTRHGAWSNWLEQRYAVLPALSSSVSNPPFPKVIAPPPPPPEPPLPPPPPPPMPRVYWSIVLALLLLGAHIINSTWLTRQQLQQFNQQMLPIETLEDLSIKRIQQDIIDLKQYQQHWTECIPAFSLARWGLSPCRMLTKQIDQEITQLKVMPVISSTGVNSIFNSNSAKLQPEAKTQLQNMLAIANANPQNNLLLVGHSDNTGNEAYNLHLSEQRAFAIRNWLIQHDIAPERITIRAVGAAEPIDSNDTDIGRQRNRRVEMLVLPLKVTNKEFTDK